MNAKRVCACRPLSGYLDRAAVTRFEINGMGQPVNVVRNLPHRIDFDVSIVNFLLWIGHRSHSRARDSRI
jgi:hypothetical protein